MTKRNIDENQRHRLNTTLEGLAINGAYLAPYVLMLELSGEEYAAMLSQVINIPFVLGELVMVGFAYSFRDYRDMLRYSFAPCYVLLLIYFIVPESPRWLISANKYASYVFTKDDFMSQTS